MENNTNADTGNKNIIKIIAFVILGIIVGYFLAGSKINPANQGALTISSDLEKANPCPTDTVYNPDTGECDPYYDGVVDRTGGGTNCPEGQIFIVNKCISPTLEQKAWFNWLEIKKMPILERIAYVDKLIETNSRVVFKDEAVTKYEITDPETGLKLKTVGILNPGYVFGKQKISADGKTITHELLKADTKNPGSYTFLREISCGGSCNGGCCQILTWGPGHWNCDCDASSWDDEHDYTPNNGCQ